MLLLRLLWCNLFVCLIYFVQVSNTLLNNVLLLWKPLLVSQGFHLSHKNWKLLDTSKRKKDAPRVRSDDINFPLRSLEKSPGRLLSQHTRRFYAKKRTKFDSTNFMQCNSWRSQIKDLVLGWRRAFLSPHGVWMYEFTKFQALQDGRRPTIDKHPL